MDPYRHPLVRDDQTEHDLGLDLTDTQMEDIVLVMKELAVVQCRIEWEGGGDSGDVKDFELVFTDGRFVQHNRLVLHTSEIGVDDKNHYFVPIMDRETRGIMLLRELLAAPIFDTHPTFDSVPYSWGGIEVVVDARRPNGVFSSTNNEEDEDDDEDDDLDGDPEDEQPEGGPSGDGTSDVPTD